jgi:hypothetical protein
MQMKENGKKCFEKFLQKIGVKGVKVPPFQGGEEVSLDWENARGTPLN